MIRVLFPTGLTSLATQSGVGEAIRHQQWAVRSLGHEVVTNPFGPFDVIHLNTPFPDTPLLALWARLRRRPVLVWAHSTEEDFRDSFTGANRLAGAFRRWIASIYRLGDAVVTPTPYARSIITRPAYGIRTTIHVLSNGVDTGFFRPDPTARNRLRGALGLEPDAAVVVSVGLQMVRKGILDWVAAARRMPEVHFLWYGQTDPRLVTRDVATAVSTAPPNCHFPGYVAKEVLRDAYCGADAFCFLTKEETEGIVLLEALACGAPVIVRDIPIYRDWLPDGQVTHMVRGHGEAFVSDVERSVRDLLAGRLPDLTAAGRCAAEELDVRRVAEQLDRIYRTEGIGARR
ncbi:1,2-diacylglycerol-3-alpha-glucose alpha-1,2-glucosyltransferase [Raineyella antarctica]|uniref:1,2-diacylglycerol-3-alpha-glucose alpha-1,2-glucosyltransferase n=1 Tax=Raineyella antarctica TaxID=1577474 RepID=A0A1G6GNH3_9ACTN|nr:glycosyltransferase family 4 protein [Raineyella antarctica]SDB83551.1 1,2-diacylglycerol-3-alpha-glucose alpha-1,2-glucosyltransferase [Raineyella antarctica]